MTDPVSAAAALLGSRTSRIKKLAAQKNGEKGGPKSWKKKHARKKNATAS